MGDVKDTLKNRGSIYGTISDNSKTTQALMRVISKTPSYEELSDEHLECLHMIFHKIARMTSGDPYHEDNPHDIGGYAKLLEEFIIEEKGKKK